MSNPDRRFRFTLIGIALTAAAGWLWIGYCRFPASPWNDIRLIPAFMAAAGQPVYTLPGQGILTTWMYGPVPLWLASPVVLAPTATAAILTAGALNLGLTVLAIILTCRAWPDAQAASEHRWLALAATIALWPEPAFRFLQADNPAVALGLIANLLLITSAEGERRPLRRWLAAFATAAAVGCKQTSLGLPVAQIIWLVWTQGTRAALVHFARGVTAGSALAAAAIAQFGFKALWFGVVTLPGSLPLAGEVAARLRENSPHLVLQAGLPLVAILLLRRAAPGANGPRRLPILSWLCALPAGLFGMLTSGGSHNSIQAFQLCAPVLLVGLCGQFRLGAGRRLALGATAIVATVMMRILAADDAPMRPDTTNLRIATALQADLPGQVWLPWNPLVSYYAEHRFYHAEDGIAVRFITGYGVPLAQARAGLPPHFHAMAVPSPNMQTGPASQLIRQPATVRQLGSWIIWTWPAESPP